MLIVMRNSDNVFSTDDGDDDDDDNKPKLKVVKGKIMPFYVKYDGENFAVENVHFNVAFFVGSKYFLKHIFELPLLFVS